LEDARILFEPAAALGDILTGLLLAFGAARQAVATVTPEYGPATM